MHIAIYVLLTILVLYSGEWIYRSFLRPVDPPTPQMLALAKHFNDVGLKGHIYPVRHMFWHKAVTASGAFQIDGYPLPVAIVHCPSEPTAEAHLRSIEISPNLTHPHRNGLLLLNLPMWGNDTGEMSARVVDAFMSFKTEN